MPSSATPLIEWHELTIPSWATTVSKLDKLLPASRDLITWEVGNQGFRMHLSGLVPGRIAEALLADGSTLDGERMQALVADAARFEQRVRKPV